MRKLVRLTANFIVQKSWNPEDSGMTQSKFSKNKNAKEEFYIQQNHFSKLKVKQRLFKRKKDFSILENSPAIPQKAKQSIAV